MYVDARFEPIVAHISQRRAFGHAFCIVYACMHANDDFDMANKVSDMLGDDVAHLLL
jgi:hypothetical protein